MTSVETPTRYLPVLDAATGRPAAPPSRPPRMEPHYLGQVVVAGHAVAVYRNGLYRLWLDISIDQALSWRPLGAVVWHVGRGPELHMHAVELGGRLVVAPGTPVAEALLRRAMEVARTA